MSSHSRVLVIGAGTIGREVARLCAERGFDRVAIHTRTPGGLATSRKILGDDVELSSATYGDLVMPPRDEDCWTVSSLIDAVGPDLVVDATNVSRRLADVGVEEALAVVSRFTIDLARTSSGAGAALVRVGTTALGGMGLDMPFTHGDQPSAQLSPRMWGKLAVSGFQTQLLWTLARTYPRVHMVVPATCVGFEPGDTQQLEAARRSESDGRLVGTGRSVEIATVRAGEGPLYTPAEIEVLTDPRLMGSTSARVVAEAVLAVASGEALHDVLASMQSASLQASPEGRAAVTKVLSRRAWPEEDAAALVTGSLGGLVTPLLLEAGFLRIGLGPRWVQGLRESTSTDVLSAVRSSLGAAELLLGECRAHGIGLVVGDEVIDAGGVLRVRVTYDQIGWWRRVACRLREVPSEASVAQLVASAMADPEIRAEARNRALTAPPAAPSPPQGRQHEQETK